MNRRFLVLGRERMPNLASRALALACWHLPKHWETRHGYAPVLAETFTDIEQFEGTCYKAAGWEPCGMSKGFERHCADYYREHGKLKKHWLKALNRNARTILTAINVPPKYFPGLNLQTPERDLPLRRPEMLSLRAYVMENMEDPRKNNRSFPFASMITFIAMALLSPLMLYTTHSQMLEPYSMPVLTTCCKSNKKIGTASKLPNKLPKVPPFYPYRRTRREPCPHRFSHRRYLSH